MMTKSVAVFLLLAGLTFVPPLAGAGQWTQTSGPDGCNVTSIVGGGGKVYGLVEGYGIYRSADRGAHWSPVGVPSTPGKDVTCLMWSEGTLFAGSSGSVAFSTDDGGRWHHVKIGPLTVTSEVVSLALIGADLLVGTASDGLYVCPDYARKFSSSCLALPKHHDFRSVAVLGQELYTCGLRGPFFRFQKTGQAWAGTELAGPRAGEVMCLQAIGPDLFAGTSVGIFRSADRGESWARITPRSDDDLYIACLGADGEDLLAGLPPILLPDAPPGVRLSKGVGQEWSMRSLGFQRTEVNGFASDGQDLYAGTTRGVWASGDRGASWRLANAGLPVASEIQNLAAIGPAILASSSQGGLLDAGLSSSPDGGATWKIVDPDLAADADIHCLAVQGQDLFLGYSEHTWKESATNGILRSPDQGRTWIRVKPGPPGDAWIYRLETKGSSIFAGTTGGVFETRDKGAHWVRRGRGLPVHAVYYLRAAADELFASLAFSALDNVPKGIMPSLLSLLSGGQRLFAAGPPPTSRLYVLRKGGSQWQDTGIRFSAPITGLAKIGTDLFVGTSGGLYVCGADLRWSQALKLQPSGPLSVTGLAVSGTDLVVGSHRGVHILRNVDGVWKLIDTGLPGETWVMDMVLTEAFLFAGTQHKGVWRLPVSELKKIGR